MAALIWAQHICLSDRQQQDHYHLEEAPPLAVQLLAQAQAQARPCVEQSAPPQVHRPVARLLAALQQPALVQVLLPGKLLLEAPPWQATLPQVAPRQPSLLQVALRQVVRQQVVLQQEPPPRVPRPQASPQLAVLQQSALRQLALVQVLLLAEPLEEEPPRQAAALLVALPQVVAREEPHLEVLLGEVVLRREPQVVDSSLP